MPREIQGIEAERPLSRGETTRRLLLASLIDTNEVIRRRGIPLEGLNAEMEQRRMLALPVPIGGWPQQEGETQTDPNDTSYRFPNFQITPTGEIYPTVLKIIDIMADVVTTPWTTAYFLMSMQDGLGGIRIAEHLGDPMMQEKIIYLAKIAASRLDL